jgi:hypothetical protein
MGLDFSKLLATTPPNKPKTVLVPPMFERDLKARSRMVKSSYDYLFAKTSLRWLFGDYMGQGLNTVLRECLGGTLNRRGGREGGVWSV